MSDLSPAARKDALLPGHGVAVRARHRRSRRPTHLVDCGLVELRQAGAGQRLSDCPSAPWSSSASYWTSAERRAWTTRPAMRGAVERLHQV